MGACHPLCVAPQGLRQAVNSREEVAQGLATSGQLSKQAVRHCWAAAGATAACLCRGACQLLEYGGEQALLVLRCSQLRGRGFGFRVVLYCSQLRGRGCVVCREGQGGQVADRQGSHNH